MQEELEQFFNKKQQWDAEYALLREIITANELLSEDYKWMHPCYTYQAKNVVLIHGFKEYCALLFHKGALMKDPEGILIQQTENVQSARQIRFASVGEINELASILKNYIAEAIEIEKSERKVELKKASEYPVPEEFRRSLDEDSALSEAFFALTPGRQKAYLFYFNQAKQSKTRESRIEKYYQQILDGKGIDD